MSKGTILVVDDERFFCTLLQNILSDDYDTVIANNAFEAFNALDEHSIDLILLDIMMPEMDGYQLCQVIKQNERFKNIPLIFLTVKSEINDELKGFELGAVDYIIKPISSPVVLARVNTQIELAQANKKLLLHTQELKQLVSQRTVELSREIAEKQKAYEKLHSLANYDQLTLLPNRNLFNERLAYSYKLAKRNKMPFSLLLIDLDRFKHINDSLGHHAGDLLLEQVGGRLSNCLRGVDTVARLGGDEFTVIITELQQKQDAAVVAEKIINELSKPFQIDEHIIHIGSSIGITCYPDDGDELNEMLKHADMAMYDVKANGKNGYAFFSIKMTENINQRMELEKALHQALADESLYLHYQPIINLQSSDICGVEALLRWKHPVHGQIAPDKIISIAEESDLIITLGAWILKTACKQFALWTEQGITGLHMAINMSTRQFGNKLDCVELIKGLILQYQIPKGSLQLEITESLMLEDSHVVLNTLAELKQLGVSLSVDDFGTGYSSLSYLRRFPVDILKIDQSFVRDLNLSSGNDILIKAIISMGQSLNLKIIAEGVETQEQLDFLRAHSCDYVQGYYFSKPVSAKEIAVLMDKTLIQA